MKISINNHVRICSSLYINAAALNACLDVVSDRFATKEDLAVTVLNSGSTNLGFQPQFTGIDPNNLAGSGIYGPNTVNLHKLLYIFPVVKSFTSFTFSGTA